MSEIKNIDQFLMENRKKEKRKSNRKKNKDFKNTNFKNPEVLLKTKFIKKHKHDYDEMFFEGFQSLGRLLVKVFNGKDGKGCKIDLEDIVDAFSKKKVAKAFLNTCQDYMDNDVEIPEVFMFLISELYLSNGEVTETKEFTKMLKIFKKANSDKIKDIKKALKKMGVDKKQQNTSSLYFALIAASFPGFKKQRPRTLKFFKVLYRSFNDGEEIKEKSIKGIIVACFGKKLGRLATFLLNDNRKSLDMLKTSQEKEVYSIVTSIILDVLNKMDNDDRKEILKKYAKGRESKANIKLRVNFYTLNDADYKKINKTVSRLVSNGIRKELFE